MFQKVAARPRAFRKRAAQISLRTHPLMGKYGPPIHSIFCERFCLTLGVCQSLSLPFGPSARRSTVYVRGWYHASSKSDVTGARDGTAGCSSSGRVVGNLPRRAASRLPARSPQSQFQFSRWWASEQPRGGDPPPHRALPAPACSHSSGCGCCCCSAFTSRIINCSAAALTLWCPPPHLDAPPEV